MSPRLRDCPQYTHASRPFIALVITACRELVPVIRSGAQTLGCARDAEPMTTTSWTVELEICAMILFESDAAFYTTEKSLQLPRACQEDYPRPLLFSA
jgi:hypothetical protein